MGIKSVEEKGLSDSEIEIYQFVDDVEVQNTPSASETSGQYNFSGFVLLWELNIYENKIGIELKGQSTGKSYGKGLLLENNNHTRFNFRIGTSRSMSFFAIDVSADFNKKELTFDGSVRKRHEGRWLPRLEYEKVIITTW